MVQQTRTADRCSIPVRVTAVLLWLSLAAIASWDSPTLAADEKAVPEGEAFFFTAPGFDEEGQAKTVSGPEYGVLHIAVTDAATGRPAPCRINVVGSDGNFYQPAENPLKLYSLTGQWPASGAKGNRKEKAPYRYLGRYFYSTGNVTVSVPPGRTRVEVFRGFESRPENATTMVSAGMHHNAEIKISRTTSMAAENYFGGDPHLHLQRVTDRDDETLFELLSAEDIWFGTPLSYNEPAGPYAGVMEKMDYPQFRGLGLDSIRSQDSVSILSGQEYRSSQYGHLNLFLRDRLVFEGQSYNADDWPVYGIVGAETKSQGGYAIQAHGGYGLEIYADAALGTVDAVELLQFGVYRGIGLIDWYHMLNSGYRFPCVGASDFPACRFLGDCRTYVWNSAAEASAATADAQTPEKLRPDFSAWLKNAAAGQSFVTTGPLLLLDVEGKRPGETILRDDAGPMSVTATIRMRCEVTNVQHVDLIVNGEVVERFSHSMDDTKIGWQTFSHPLQLDSSSWIAARAWSTTPGGQPDAESHTNPVYVYLGGRKPYVRSSLDEWVRQVDGQIAKHTTREFEKKSRVLNYFQQARDRLLSIRERNGLLIGDDPSVPPDTLGQTESQGVAMDPSRADVTDEELKEFLKPVPSRPPEEAVKMFEGVNGFHMELVAAEPLVNSPVAAAFDEDGNLFVCEMTDYPYKPVAGADPIGTLRLLRDTDGDGTYDEAHVFADKLLWAAGVVPWKGGVFVAATPDILYLKDTDGDFRADIRRRVFTGFGNGNQQAMVNNLQLGLDQWIYGATAGNGGLIRPGDKPEASGILINGRDFRFHPVTEEFEPVTGTEQFGNTFDDWGNRFVCSQSEPLQQVVLPDHYLARNPFLPSPGGIQDIAPGPVPIFRISPVERWREIRSSRRIARDEQSASSSGRSHHVVDAAAGVTIYRGGAWPAEYYGQAFVGDGQNNLIHRRQLTPDGVLFKSERVDEQTDFIRTPDIWFRPVNLVNAPDGTLYCCDMNREVLESIHIPLDVVKHLDLKSGRRNGRIYRIAPRGFQFPGPPQLSHATSKELLVALESPHGWWRDTAHRLLYERQDISIAPGLLRLATESGRPQTRLQAAWLLKGLNQLDDATCLTLLTDVHPGVRENAVRLAESQMQNSHQIIAAVCRMADDEAPRVRFQTAFTLGESRDPLAVEALARIARRDGEDSWIRTAVLSSASETAEPLFAALTSSTDSTSATRAITRQLAALIGARSRPEEVSRTLQSIADSPVGADSEATFQLLIELGSGLKRSGGLLASNDLGSEGAQLLRDAMLRAGQTATDPAAAVDVRVAAVSLLSCLPSPEHRDVFTRLLDVDQPGPVQIASVRALADDPDSRAPELLLKHWPTFVPETRTAALTGLLSRETGTLAFLRAADRGEVSVADVEPTRRELLLKDRNHEIRQLAAKLFGTAGSRARQSVVAEYKSALSLKGDATAGAKTFEKTCSACHQLGGIGHSIGPNLASSPSRDASALLNNILDPNQFVLPNYLQYIVVDHNGRTYTGLLSSQSATSITLKKEKAETITILRGDIDELVSSNKSLMPEGLEKDLSPQSMADLIAWMAVASAQSPGNPNEERDFGTLPGLIEGESGP